MHHLATLNLPTVAGKSAERADLAAAIAAFEASGGAIHQLSHIERAPYRPISYNNRVDRKAKGRREFLEEQRQLAEHARALAAMGLTAEQAGRQMRKRWTGRAVVTSTRLEQIAAKYGFFFACDARGRP